MASTQKQKKSPEKVRPAGFPTRDQVMDFITSSDQPAGKREIAKAFGLKGQEKIALKALLKDMADEGLLDIGPARAFHKMGGVPKVTVLRIVDVDDTTLIATPERWEADAHGAGVDQHSIPLADLRRVIRVPRLQFDLGIIRNVRRQRDQRLRERLRRVVQRAVDHVHQVVADVRILHRIAGQLAAHRAENLIDLAVVQFHHRGVRPADGDQHGGVL